MIQGVKGRDQRSWEIDIDTYRLLMCVLRLLVVSNSMDGSTPGSFVHGISQAKILERIANSFSKGSSQPRDRTCVASISCIAGGFFIAKPLGKPL